MAAIPSERLKVLPNTIAPIAVRGRGDHAGERHGVEIVHTGRSIRVVHNPDVVLVTGTGAGFVPHGDRRRVMEVADGSPIRIQARPGYVLHRFEDKDYSPDASGHFIIDSRE